ncbi:hypothetical protein WJX73_010604 [Symbiochloris irregularis]|uniref:Amino acid transporter transmembrane domain-containing protein n=1 Tax=Symbiochloris irregularis TaxID=706552 RepID=A0AAW1P3F1_9CHLO
MAAHEPHDIRAPLLDPDAEAAEAREPVADSSVQLADKASSSGGAWPLTTAIMVGEMLGVGSLAMPAAFARLGWVAALSVLVAMGAAVAFSGVMFSRLGTLLPGARSFDDLGAAAFGRRGRILAFCTVNVAIFAAPALLHLTCAESLQQIFAHQGLTHTQAILIIAAVILPLSQARHLEHVSWLSLVGTLGMLTALGVACGKLLFMAPRHEPAAPTPSGSTPPSDPEIRHGFYAVLVALMDAVFAFGGQQNWVRYMTGLKKKAHFKYAATAASAIMTAAFIIMGSVGYWRLGTHFDQTQPITSVLPLDAWTPVMNGGLLAHCILAYQIDLNVWAHTALLLVAPRYADPQPPTAPPSDHRRSAMLWLLFSLLGAACCTLIAWVVPFFNTVMGLIAAIGDMSAAFVLPAAFCLVLTRRRMRRPPNLCIARDGSAVAE